MSTNKFLIFDLLLLALVLASDLGRRKITGMRVLRPLVGAAIIAPRFIGSPAGSGWGLTLELVGVGLGLGLGLVALRLMPVTWDEATRRAFSRAGATYAALWATLSVVRYGFAFGARHVFPTALRDFMISEHVAPAALTDALIAVFLTMYLTRSVGLFFAGRRARRGARLRSELKPIGSPARQVG